MAQQTKNESKEQAPSVPAENVTPEDAEYIEKYWDKLSYTTKHAKWINSPNQHEDHPGQALVTRSHDVIKQWAEKRGGVPSTVPGTEHDGHLGVLRFDFPGYGGQKLEHVNWDKWFQTFDDRKLTFIFQEKTKSGHESNFFQMDSPFREHE